MTHGYIFAHLRILGGTESFTGCNECRLLLSTGAQFALFVLHRVVRSRGEAFGPLGDVAARPMVLGVKYINVGFSFFVERVRAKVNEHG